MTVADVRNLVATIGPPDPDAANQASNNVTLTWDAVTDATAYDVLLLFGNEQDGWGYPWIRTNIGPDRVWVQHNIPLTDGDWAWCVVAYTADDHAPGTVVTIMQDRATIGVPALPTLPPGGYGGGGSGTGETVTRVATFSALPPDASAVFTNDPDASDDPSGRDVMQSYVEAVDFNAWLAAQGGVGWVSGCEIVITGNWTIQVRGGSVQIGGRIAVPVTDLTFNPPDDTGYCRRDSIRVGTDGIPKIVQGQPASNPVSTALQRDTNGKINEVLLGWMLIEPVMDDGLARGNLARRAFPALTGSDWQAGPYDWKTIGTPTPNVTSLSEQQIVANEDLSEQLAVGMKVRCTDSGVIKYFIITKVEKDTVTLLGPRVSAGSRDFSKNKRIGFLANSPLNIDNEGTLLGIPKGLIGVSEMNASTAAWGQDDPWWLIEHPCKRGAVLPEKDANGRYYVCNGPDNANTPAPDGDVAHPDYHYLGFYNQEAADRYIASWAMRPDILPCWPSRHIPGGDVPAGADTNNVPHLIALIHNILDAHNVAKRLYNVDVEPFGTATRPIIFTPYREYNVTAHRETWDSYNAPLIATMQVTFRNYVKTIRDAAPDDAVIWFAFCAGHLNHTDKADMSVTYPGDLLDDGRKCVDMIGTDFYDGPIADYTWAKSKAALEDAGLRFSPSWAKSIARGSLKSHRTVTVGGRTYPTTNENLPLIFPEWGLGWSIAGSHPPSYWFKPDNVDFINWANEFIKNDDNAVSFASMFTGGGTQVMSTDNIPNTVAAMQDAWGTPGGQKSTWGGQAPLTQIDPGSFLYSWSGGPSFPKDPDVWSCEVQHATVDSWPAPAGGHLPTNQWHTMAQDLGINVPCGLWDIEFVASLEIRNKPPDAAGVGQNFSGQIGLAAPSAGYDDWDKTAIYHPGDPPVVTPSTGQVWEAVDPALNPGTASPPFQENQGYPPTTWNTTQTVHSPKYWKAFGGASGGAPASDLKCVYTFNNMYSDPHTPDVRQTLQRRARRQFSTPGVVTPLYLNVQVQTTVTDAAELAGDICASVVRAYCLYAL